MPRGRPNATYWLRRDKDGTPLLDIELARRNLRVADLVRAGASASTLARLRLQPDYDKYGQATTLNTAYKIARAIDPDDPDTIVAKLFERVDDPPG